VDSRKQPPKAGGMAETWTRSHERPPTTYTQARVRVNEEGAHETLEALNAHIGFLLDARTAVGDVTPASKLLNKRLKDARRVVAEVERVIDEQGWSTEDQDGEPQSAL
jgi:hypothetical protein